MLHHTAAAVVLSISKLKRYTINEMPKEQTIINFCFYQIMTHKIYFNKRPIYIIASLLYLGQRALRHVYISLQPASSSTVVLQF